MNVAARHPRAAGARRGAFSWKSVTIYGFASMAGYDGQVTLPGYDNMSGIGSPSGQAFISALRAREK